jgi:hypothetical protein
MGEKTSRTTRTLSQLWSILGVFLFRAYLTAHTRPSQRRLGPDSRAALNRTKTLSTQTFCIINFSSEMTSYIWSKFRLIAGLYISGRNHIPPPRNTLQKWPFSPSPNMQKITPHALALASCVPFLHLFYSFTYNFPFIFPLSSVFSTYPLISFSFSIFPFKDRHFALRN